MIIFLYGPDTYRGREKLKEFKAKFVKEVDPGQGSLSVIDGERATLEMINEAAGAASLFAKRRMVVVENIFQNKNKDIFPALVGYLSAKEKADDGSGAIMIFTADQGEDELKANPLFQFLKKGRVAQEFKILSNTDAIDWIKREAKRRGGNLRGQAAVRLEAIFGSDLWQLSNEINKLINFKRGGQPGLINVEQMVEIELEDVENLVRGSADENIFAFTDALSRKDKAKALELFENELRAGVTDAYLLSMIIRQFKILIQLSEAMSAGLTSRKIQNDLKLHPYVIQKAGAQAKNFRFEDLRLLYQEAVDADYQIKTGQTDVRTAVCLMIGTISN